jgi:hypothetical protein
LRASKFSLDPFNIRSFDGYSLDESWNGFACPYFTFEQAHCVVDVCRRFGIRAWYEEESDQFVFVDEDESSERNECEMFSATVIDGAKLYPIGAFSWIWEEIGVER